MFNSDLNRREILKSLFGMTAALMLPEMSAGQQAPATSPATVRDRYGELLPQRRLGKTGAMVTMLGLGGSHVGRPSEAEAQKIIETAIAGGVRFFDCAVVYQNGGAETRYGQFLTPKYRDVIFLMTKSQTQKPEDTRKDLEDSLRRLKTDYLDLWQMHDHRSIEDVDARIDNGVIEVLLDAKAKGRVKHIGFTGHWQASVHMHMLDRLARDKKDVLETCQMPINLADPSFNSFVLKVLPEVVRRGYGVLAMKTLAGGGFGGRGSNPRIVPGVVTAADALQFAWSLPISCLISGPDSAVQYQETIDIARSFKALDEQRRMELIAKVAPLVKNNNIEYYKAPNA
jgi:aryl-alcohol dehydrogenase-like predicted oxidoreductase